MLVIVVVVIVVEKLVDTVDDPSIEALVDILLGELVCLLVVVVVLTRV